MTPNIQEWIRQRVQPNPGLVLEIGSLNINGGVKQYFNVESYIGIDIQAGPGVDRILNGHDINKVWPENTFDTVICLETLEHDSEFWTTIANIKTVLKPNGYLYLSMPTIGFPFHYPPDYWRFTEMGLKNLFRMADCEIIEVATLKDTANYDGVIGYGVKK